MKGTKVLFFWDVPKRLQKYLTAGISSPDIELIFPDKTDEETFLSISPKVDILVGWRPSKNLLKSAKRSRLFINPGAGINRLIDLFREVNQSRSPHLVMVNGHGNSYFTAQHVVALLLATLNKIVDHHFWMKSGHWRRRDNFAKSMPLRWKKIGLLGYGAINQKVHQFLKGFDVEFAALKTEWDEKPVNLDIYTPAGLNIFLENIDILILAVPQTKNTEEMIGSDQLEILGPHGIIVNVARGSIINEEALYNFLSKNKLSGAGLDVWYDYDPQDDDDGKKYPSNFPFHKLENVVLSPHRGASPMDDLQRWDEVIENITRYANERTDFLNVVDLEREY